MHKKLYKSRYDTKIDGVCGGIANYFNVAPKVVRILWVIFTIIAFPVAIATYIAGMLLIPRDPTSIE